MPDQNRSEELPFSSKTGPQLQWAVLHRLMTEIESVDA